MRQFGGGHDRIKDLAKHPRSKFENKCANYFEEITGHKFPTVYPQWLKWKGRQLELDGYSADIGIAFEAQGPHHVKHYAKAESYKTYVARIESDNAKLDLCHKNGVSLITIDITTPEHLLKAYIKSRLWDLGDKGRRFVGEEKPEPYVPPIVIAPWVAPESVPDI